MSTYLIKLCEIMSLINTIITMDDKVVVLLF